MIPRQISTYIIVDNIIYRANSFYNQPSTHASVDMSNIQQINYFADKMCTY